MYFIVLIGFICLSQINGLPHDYSLCNVFIYIFEINKYQSDKFNI